MNIDLTGSDWIYPILTFGKILFTNENNFPSKWVKVVPEYGMGEMENHSDLMVSCYLVTNDLSGSDRNKASPTWG